MMSWKTLLIGFLLGLIAGGGWGAWYVGERGGRWDRHHRDPERVLERFTKDLSLTPDQRAAVGEVLAAKREKLMSIRSELRPRMEEIRNNARGEIRALLMPEQQTRFDALEAERDARRKKRREERRQFRTIEE